jgi:hypothetical protein
LHGSTASTDIDTSKTNLAQSQINPTQDYLDPIFDDVVHEYGDHLHDQATPEMRELDKENQGVRQLQICSSTDSQHSIGNGDSSLAEGDRHVSG